METCPDQRKDVEAFLIPFLREAERDADNVNAFLEAVGAVPPLEERQGHPVALPADLLWKIAALVRIYQWEKSGLRPFLRANLPPAREVLEDVLGIPERPASRFSGVELAKAVFRVHLSQLAWSRLPDSPSDVAVAQALDPDETLDLVAQFLWQFRHLATQERQP